MLTSTFIHIARVGTTTERKIWGQGISSWDQFLEKPQAACLSSNFTQRIEGYIQASKKALDQKDINFFAESLPKNQMWRLYPEFKEEMAFLDIETTGLDLYSDTITVVGLYGGGHTLSLIKGKNLTRKNLRDELSKYTLIATYNGASFDLPFMRVNLGVNLEDKAHIDLRWLFAGLEYRGGLKQIEKQLGISRPDRIEGIDGSDAVILWELHQKGNPGALDLLVEYNISDVINLKKLLEIGYAMKKEQTFPTGKERKVAEQDQTEIIERVGFLLGQSEEWTGKVTEFLLSVRDRIHAKRRLTVRQRKEIDELYEECMRENDDYLFEIIDEYSRTGDAQGICDLLSSDFPVLSYPDMGGLSYRDVHDINKLPELSNDRKIIQLLADEKTSGPATKKILDFVYRIEEVVAKRLREGYDEPEEGEEEQRGECNTTEECEKYTHAEEDGECEEHGDGESLLTEYAEAQAHLRDLRAGRDNFQGCIKDIRRSTPQWLDPKEVEEEFRRLVQSEDEDEE